MTSQTTADAVARHMAEAVEGCPDDLVIHLTAGECRALLARLAECEAELENERQRLAACSMAALGYLKRGDFILDEFRSAALTDVFDLSDKYRTTPTVTP